MKQRYTIMKTEEIVVDAYTQEEALQLAHNERGEVQTLEVEKVETFKKSVVVTATIEVAFTVTVDAEDDDESIEPDNDAIEEAVQEHISGLDMDIITHYIDQTDDAWTERVW
jgi:hypothetical protein